MKICTLWLALAALSLAACSSDPDKKGPTKSPSFDEEPNRARLVEKRRELTLEAGELYKLARVSLESADFNKAIERYDLISVRYPFTDYATQSELERIYSLYRNFEPDKALSAAERFAREHPRHPAMDYVQYLKGLTNFERDQSPLNILPVDEAKSDVGSYRRAFDDFQVLIQKYPKSQYVGDAYSRMIFVRNRLADHEMHVVDFYIRRGAYIAAAKRAEQVIAQYPGSAASYAALEALVTAYDRAGLETQAADARRLMEAQDWVDVSGEKEPAPAKTVSAAPTPAAVPVAAIAAPPEAAPAAAEEEESGFFGWFTDLFSGLDSSKPDYGYEVVIPSAKKTETQASGDVETQPVATISAEGAATPATADVKTAAPTPAPNKVRVFFEPYDDEAEKPAAPAAAVPAS